MPAESDQLDFLHYLLCDLPFGYPLKTPVTRLLDTSLTFASRRELLHQQARFLDYSKNFLGPHPWITYLAAIKHEAVFVTIPTYSAQLVDIVDQLFFNELQQKCKEVRDISRAGIDDATALTCERLILLQSEAPQIEDARKSVRAALAAGFKGVEPLPPPPPEPAPAHGAWAYYLGGGVISLIIGAVIPPFCGGMAWAVAGLVVTGIVATRFVRKEKVRVDTEGAKFKAYMIHESYYSLCKKSVALVLALPFEVRKSALVDLSPCLTALDALAPERDALEAMYIRSFLSK